MSSLRLRLRRGRRSAVAVCRVCRRVCSSPFVAVPRHLRSHCHDVPACSFLILILSFTGSSMPRRVLRFSDRSLKMAMILTRVSISLVLIDPDVPASVLYFVDFLAYGFLTYIRDFEQYSTIQGNKEGQSGVLYEVKFMRFAMVMDWIRLRRGIFLVILVAVAFSASVSAQSERKSEALKRVAKDLGRRSKIELESLEHGKWGDKNDQKLVIRDAAGGEIPASSGLGIFDAFFASLSMILVSEIGDETFINTALMAMRHPKSIVLSEALAALIVMIVLSTGLGRIVPNLISRKHTNSAATEDCGGGFVQFAMVMDWIRLRRGIFLVILIAVAFSASVSAKVLERESERKSDAFKRVAKDLGRRSKSLEHGKWGDKNDQKLVIRDAAGGEIPASSGLGIFDAFFASLSMILVSEIGDETFIIAALMAMRHPKSIVLSGALAALIVMTVSSSRLNSSYWFELFIFETAFCRVGFHFDVKLPPTCDIWFHHAHEDYEFTS
ncbi:hypothetical protein Syun_000694 [Stephania yunnanensis]|uniref:GDT1 family protein n=1 Tax=Stephania yunnanensis TaxID=152371 RepID=A0AAP0LGF8_9MAGN